VLQKYFSPEEQQALREQVRKARQLKRGVHKVPQAHHETRLEKLVERFQEIGGVLLLNEGQVAYFIPEETAVSRVLVASLRSTTTGFGSALWNSLERLISRRSKRKFASDSAPLR
jgi:hypothetical protein